MKEIFTGIFKSGKELFTKNLIPGKRVYGERLVVWHGSEYREWVPQRSKLAAALVNGLQSMPVKSGSRVLYLGAATGTTPSHVSDIIGLEGVIYALEFSEKPFRSLIELAKQRPNIVPLLADARKPEDYCWVEECGVVYSDLAQPDLTEITIRNFNEFVRSGFIMLSIKSQSIDVVKPPAEIYEQEKRKLEKAGFDV
ncbi:MAG: fibrillarin-like rRNA/tRNA 2'-O-methyltransferase, partial [Candidatus Aenigmarchaeota archaeon]|nr:fibrillarin-like rRNA/tRNA 2'-O-methyltransferase [Candidatus Aenigmarchaeota archaeon]